MLVYFGTSSRSLHNGRLNQVTCPLCKKETSMNYSIHGRYWHFFFIPCVPIGKKVMTQCPECDTIFDAITFNGDLYKKMEREKQTHPTRYPVWFYSGIGILLLFIGWIVYDIQTEAKNNLIYLANPKPGDVYRTTVDEKYYTTYRVGKVTKDSLYLFANQLQVDQNAGISDIDKDENYKELYATSREEVKKLFKEEKIYQIDRP